MTEELAFQSGASRKCHCFTAPRYTSTVEDVWRVLCSEGLRALGGFVFCTRGALFSLISQKKPSPSPTSWRTSSRGPTERQYREGQWKSKGERIWYTLRFIIFIYAATNSDVHRLILVELTVWVLVFYLEKSQAYRAVQNAPTPPCIRINTWMTVCFNGIVSLHMQQRDCVRACESLSGAVLSLPSCRRWPYVYTCASSPPLEFANKTVQ